MNPTPDHNPAADAYAKLSFNLGLFSGDLLRDQHDPTVSRQLVVTVLRHLAWGGEYQPETHPALDTDRAEPAAGP